MIGSNDVKFPIGRGEKRILQTLPKLCSSLLNQKRRNGKSRRWVWVFFKRDLELKGYDDGGQDVMYGVDSLICKIIIYVLQVYIQNQ